MKRLFYIALTLLALTGFCLAVWAGWMTGEFSWRRCTISWLGSPENSKGTGAWRWYQAGMTSALILFACLVLERRARLRRLNRKGITTNTRFYLSGLILLLLGVYIPDSRELLFAGIQSGKIHNPLAVAGIVLIAIAILLDRRVLNRSGLSDWKWSAPFWLFIGLASCCLSALVVWQIHCEAHPEIPCWPGIGIFSTPLWEWILFAYFIPFIIWISTRRIPEVVGQEALTEI